MSDFFVHLSVKTRTTFTVFWWMSWTFTHHSGLCVFYQHSALIEMCGILCFFSLPHITGLAYYRAGVARCSTCKSTCLPACNHRRWCGMGGAQTFPRLGRGEDKGGSVPLLTASPARSLWTGRSCQQLPAPSHHSALHAPTGSDRQGADRSKHTRLMRAQTHKLEGKARGIFACFALRSKERLRNISLETITLFSWQHNINIKSFFFQTVVKLKENIMILSDQITEEKSSSTIPLIKDSSQSGLF